MEVGDEMLYIPMFKGRQYEHKVMGDTAQYFSESMVPLIEILKDHYRPTDFATDPKTGEYLRRGRGKQLRRYRTKPTESDRDTLQYYSGLVSSKKAFIDYFRFTTDLYGRQLKASALELSVKINQNENLYVERLLEIQHYPTLIPVLSIKKGFFPQVYKVTNLVERLQDSNTQIAVRFDDVAFEAFLFEICPVLRDEDYIMYDISEQNVSSKRMELDEFNKVQTSAHKIILNSPRKRNVNNGDYENRMYTSLIDNSARNVREEYSNIIGFGDYCGMKDALPINAKITRGSALALFYQYKANRFMAYVNSNSSEGIRGYINIIPQILEDTHILDPSDTCPVLNEVRVLAFSNSLGGWGNWNKFNMIRYLTQMYENM